MFTGHTFKAFDSNIIMGAVGEFKNCVYVFNKIESDAKRFENRFSRFIPESELNRLNNKNDSAFKASKEMISLLKSAKTAYEFTGGIFDPTVVTTLKNIGYDKSFKPINGFKRYSRSKISYEFQRRTAFNSLKINENRDVIFSPGLNIDLGGIAKGYWVDKVVKMFEKYFNDFWISAGGDVYLKGSKEDRVPFELGVQNPLDHDYDILVLKIPSYGVGVATSGITKRRGGEGKKLWHHIIDPRTGFSADNSILSVTVLADSTMNADVMAKTVLILGINKGLAQINGMKNFECIIIDDNLKIHFSNGMEKFL